MLTLTKHIEKRIVMPFIFAFLVEIVFKILFGIFDDNKLDMIHGVWIMIATSLLVVYSLYDLFTLTFSRKYYFYYATKYSITSVLVIHALLYILNNMIFYLLYVDYDHANIIGKLISLLCFYALDIALLLLFRFFSNVKYNSLLYLLCLLITNLIYPILLISMSYKQDTIQSFMIGSSNNNDVFQIYTGAIPITIIEGTKNLLTTHTLMINSAILLVSLVLYVSLKSRRYNW